MAEKVFNDDNKKRTKWLNIMLTTIQYAITVVVCAAPNFSYFFYEMGWREGVVRALFIVSGIILILWKGSFKAYIISVICLPVALIGIWVYGNILLALHTPPTLIAAA